MPVLGASFYVTSFFSLCLLQQFYGLVTYTSKSLQGVLDGPTLPQVYMSQKQPRIYLQNFFPQSYAAAHP